LRGPTLFGLGGRNEFGQEMVNWLLDKIACSNTTCRKPDSKTYEVAVPGLGRRQLDHIVSNNERPPASHNFTSLYSQKNAWNVNLLIVCATSHPDKRAPMAHINHKRRTTLRTNHALTCAHR